VAVAEGYISGEELEHVKRFAESPDTWYNGW
jgi:hypothetical protein